MPRRNAVSASRSPELALPRTFDAGYGQQVDRGLSLGGGGLFFVAWQVAYLQTLAGLGLRFDGADRIVGTSAGSMVASALAGGRLKLLHSQITLLARLPALVSALAPASVLKPSQQRALDLFLKATDGEPATVQAIGHAALGAATPRAESMRRNVSFVLGPGRLTSEALQITCVDTYTGERRVVTRDTKVTLARAVAASSAVPGLFAPQPIGDRLCMDGGVSGTGSHLDLLGGSKRVLVLALTDGADLDEGMMTANPDDGRREVEDLEGSGTSVMLRTPKEVDLMDLMSPSAVPRAVAMGTRQATDDLKLLTTFWG